LMYVQLIVSLHSLPVVSAAHSPQTLAVRLLRWVEGVTLSSLKSFSIEILLEAGLFLGKICFALDGVSLDTKKNSANSKQLGDWHHAWDGKQTSDLRQYLHCIKDFKRRNIVQSIITKFEEQVLPDAHLFRTGILQADFNDANIIIQDDHVSGVVDFGDTLKSWRVLDVTVSMAYAMLTSYGKSNRSLAAAAAILRGFHSLYPLLFCHIGSVFNSRES